MKNTVKGRIISAGLTDMQEPISPILPKSLQRSWHLRCTFLFLLFGYLNLIWIFFFLFFFSNSLSWCGRGWHFDIFYSEVDCESGNAFIRGVNSQFKRLCQWSNSGRYTDVRKSVKSNSTWYLLHLIQSIIELIWIVILNQLEEPV